MRKICSILLCGCVTFSICACGMEKGESNQKSSSKSEADGLTTMKVGYARDTSFHYEGEETAENNAWLDLYHENGIDLNVIYDVDLSQKTEKLAQTIMSGDYPDFMDVDSKNFTGWAQQGVFADLTDGFDKYASDEVKKYYDSEAGKRALQAATVDGKLYSLPVVATPNDSMPLLWIRQDWLDNLGLDIPETVDDFYKVAKAFKENDPDKNGKADTYGFAVNGKDVFQQVGDLGTYFEMFGAQPGYFSNIIPFIEEDKKAVFGGMKSDEMKDGLTLLQNMYNEGLISQDFVTSGQDQINQDMAAGKVGMTFSIFYGAEAPWKNALETQPEADFVSAPIPGVTEEERGQAFYTALPSQYYCMSSKFDDMEAFFTMVNLHMQYLAQPDKLSQEDYEKYNGLPGKYTGYTLAVAAFAVPDKNMVGWERIQNALKGDTSELNAENTRDFEAMQVYCDNKDRRAELNETELAAFNGGILYWSVYGNEHCAYQSLNEMVDMDHYLYSTYDNAATEKMNECTTSLITLTKETLVDIIAGNKSVDSYDDFLKQWNSLGGKEITEEADAWYQSAKTSESAE